MTLLRLNDVGKSFGGLRALYDVSFNVEAGEVVGLMGANGAGKTTLFSLIAGHQTCDHGDIEFNGRSIKGLRPNHVCRLGIARTFQIVRPFPSLSALENVETALYFGKGALRNNTEVTTCANQILQDVGLDDVAHMPAQALTLSRRKRLEIARALGTKPTLLLLDEVMAGLTPGEVDQMIHIMQTLKCRYSLTIVMVEHLVQALYALSDRILVLHHGELIAQGRPEDIAKDPVVRSVYFDDEPVL